MFLTQIGQRTTRHNSSTSVTVYIEKENQKERVEIHGWDWVSSSFRGPAGQAASETGWVGTRWADREKNLLNVLHNTEDKLATGTWESVSKILQPIASEWDVP